MTATTAAFPSALSDASRSSRRWSRRVAADLVGFLDAAAVIAGGLVPALIYQAGGNMPIDWARHVQVCLLSAVIVYGFLRSYGMYDSNRMHDFPVHPMRLLSSLSLAFFAVLGLGMPFTPGNMHMWIWYAVWVALSFYLLASMRYLVRQGLAYLTRTGVFNARIAVYGSGQIARRVHDHLADPALAITFAGLFDDRDANRLSTEGLPITGRLSDLIARAKSGAIDRIIIALPQAADRRTQQIAARLEHLPVNLHIVTHIASDLVDGEGRHQVSSLGPVGLIDVKTKPLLGWGRVVKAVEDRVLALLLLVVCAPVMLAAAAAIRLEGKGPILFRQRRSGRNGRVIEVMKFRTMRVLEDGATVPQATRNDPRVTTVGRFLRRTSIDELPQLLNVLKGDMSLVGPRPHALAHDQQFTEIIERYPSRQQVNPGITGLAQVEGWRGEIETAEMLVKRLEKDLEYVNTWSLWLDLRILARTPLSCCTSKTAY